MSFSNVYNRLLKFIFFLEISTDVQNPTSQLPVRTEYVSGETVQNVSAPYQSMSTLSPYQSVSTLSPNQSVSTSAPYQSEIMSDQIEDTQNASNMSIVRY